MGVSLYEVQKLLFHVNRDRQVRARFLDERERVVSTGAGLVHRLRGRGGSSPARTVAARGELPTVSTVKLEARMRDRRPSLIGRP